jgi:hypothetical protein
MSKLCKQLAVEKDKATFQKLVDELNEIVKAKDQRLGTPPKA